MAILALITGVPFLAYNATALLETTRGMQLNIEVPENISHEKKGVCSMRRTNVASVYPNETSEVCLHFSLPTLS